MGSGAADLFEMPVNSRYWRQAQRVLAFMLEQAEMVFLGNGLKL